VLLILIRINFGKLDPDPHPYTHQSGQLDPPHLHQSKKQDPIRIKVKGGSLRGSFWSIGGSKSRKVSGRIRIPNEIESYDLDPNPHQHQSEW
jgi:hypothetical protein